MNDVTGIPLPTGRIDESTTNPRKIFGDLKGLADSIAAHGVLQPVTVRPNAKTDRFELVIGARRLRAAKLAGLTEIPCIVRDLSDGDALEIQIVENLQRLDVTALEEAAGFEALRKAGLSIDQMVERTGKTRATIYARLKLCDLGKEGRQALEGGEISASVALLVARLPSALQSQALKKLYDGITSAEAEALLRRFLVPLEAGFFEPADSGLVPKAGACGPCPKRSGNARELYPEIKSADVCTDAVCFEAKQDAAWKIRSAAEIPIESLDPEKGPATVRVLTKPALEKAIAAGALVCDSVQVDVTAYDGPTWRQVVKKRLPVIAIYRQAGGYDDPPGGRLLEYYDGPAARKLAPKAKAAPISPDAAAAKARAEKNRAIRARIALARPALLRAAKKLRRPPAGLFEYVAGRYARGDDRKEVAIHGLVDRLVQETEQAWALDFGAVERLARILRVRLPAPPKATRMGAKS